MNRFTWTILTFIMSFFTLATLLALKVFSLFGLEKAKNWLVPRKNIQKNLKSLERIHHLQRPVVLAYASSAGEYEQILPVLHRLMAEGWAPVITFFSPSGMKYATVRAEEIPWIPTPLDTIWHVKAFFDAIQPKLVLISKQELWPCFLWEASRRAKLILIDAAAPISKQAFSLLKNWLNCSFYRLFHGIYCVSESDYAWFKQCLGNSQRIHLAGDTKYDRAVERLILSKVQREKCRLSWLDRFGNQDVMLIGSAWPHDLKFVLEAFKHLEKKPSLVIVPHEPSSIICNQMMDLLTNYGIKFSLFSKSEQTESEAVIVDQLGVLFDLYDIASWVWVGGAVTYQVHNVLEPTMRSIPTAFGKKYQNSQEARELVAKDLVFTSSDPIKLAAWLKTKPPKVDCLLDDHFRQKLGASDLILKYLKKF